MKLKTIFLERKIPKVVVYLLDAALMFGVTDIGKARILSCAEVDGAEGTGRKRICTFACIILDCFV